MIRLITVVLLLLSFVNPTQAKNEHKPVLYLNTGITFPSAPEEFNRYWNPGPNFGIGLGYQATISIVLQASFEYNNIPLDDRKLLEDYGLSGLGLNISGGSAKITTACANFKANLSPMTTSISPYFIVGAGLFRISVSDAKIFDQEHSLTMPGKSETALGFSLGVGSDFRLNDRLMLFWEGKYALGFTKVDNTLYCPIKIGIAFR
jgi:hypothetical protein